MKSSKYEQGVREIKVGSHIPVPPSCYFGYGVLAVTGGILPP